ncbi:MAG: TetR/AcrR family transcriptional regulator [Solirubrobacteraceae bacterium]
MESSAAPPAHRTATAILDAAAHVLAADGDASMADVASAAGVSRATLYRYFFDRDALVAAVASHALADAGARLADAGLDRVPVDEAVRRMVRALLAVGDRYGVLIRDQVQAEPLEAHRLIGAPMDAVFTRGIDEGVLRQDIPAEVLVVYFGHALLAATKINEHGHLGLEETSALTASMFLDGARAR